MKKYLLSTSALASVALISSLASAEVELAGKVELNFFSGDGHAGQSEVVDDADLVISGTTTTDGGLEVTGKFEIESGTFDDPELNISGGFGTIKLHDADLYSGAAGSLGIYAASVAAGFGGVDGNGSNLFTGTRYDEDATSPTGGGVEIYSSYASANGVTYISNNFGGVSFGATMYFGEGEDADDNKTATTGQEIGFAYNADIGPGSLGLSYTSASQTVEQYTADEGYEGDVDSQTDKSKNSIGLSYSAGAISFAYAQINEDAPEDIDGEKDGHETSSTHLGIAYNFGAGNISYTTISTDYTDSDGDFDNSASTAVISLDYSLGEGVTLLVAKADATNLKLDGNNAPTDEEAEGTSEYIIGINVNF